MQQLAARHSHGNCYQYQCRVTAIIGSFVLLSTIATHKRVQMHFRMLNTQIQCTQIHTDTHTIFVFVAIDWRTAFLVICIFMYMAHNQNIARL